jgi:hypothetical protein
VLFLVSYDRKSGIADWSKDYPDAEAGTVKRLRDQAENDARRRGLPLEIVVLQARSKDDLKLTHAKYFGDAALRENIRTLTQ